MKKRCFAWFLFGLMVIAALAFTACGEKGGTIEVTNGYSMPTVVSVGKGLIVIPNADNTKTIPVGGTEKWTFDEDGTYAIIAAPPVFSKTVTLNGGKTESVTVK